MINFPIFTGIVKFVLCYVQGIQFYKIQYNYSLILSNDYHHFYLLKNNCMVLNRLFLFYVLCKLPTM